MGGGDATTAARLDSTPVKDTARARGAAAARRGECSIDFLRDAGESQMRRWIMSFQPNASSSDGVTLSEAPDDVWWWPPDVNADAPRRPSRGLLGCSQYSVSTLPSQSTQCHVSTVSRKCTATGPTTKPCTHVATMLGKLDSMNSMGHRTRAAPVA